MAKRPGRQPEPAAPPAPWHERLLARFSPAVVALGAISGCVLILVLIFGQSPAIHSADPLPTDGSPTDVAVFPSSDPRSRFVQTVSGAPTTTTAPTTATPTTTAPPTTESAEPYEPPSSCRTAAPGARVVATSATTEPATTEPATTEPATTEPTTPPTTEPTTPPTTQPTTPTLTTPATTRPPATSQPPTTSADPGDC